MEALRLERAIYNSATPAEANGLLMAKVEVRKQQGLYREAMAELNRVRLYALTGEALAEYYYQRALCGYLAADFTGALVAIDECRLYLPNSGNAQPRLLLIEALAAGEIGQWERSRGAAELYLQDGPEELKCAIGEIYDTAPSMRNPMVGWWLSLLPGAGQIYAGELWSGLLSLLVNSGCVAFGISEAVAGHWLSGWLIGGGVLSTTYFVGQERAYQLTSQRNQRVLREHNDLLRGVLLGEQR